MEKYVVIVAGGKGSRMQSEKPKQFLLLAGLPVLMHTINAFYAYDERIIIKVVLPEGYIEEWNGLVAQYQFAVEHEVVAGGGSRFESVKNGLNTVLDQGLVAIHDGARPLVSQEVIGATFDLAERNGNAIAAVPVKDSIRQVSGKVNKGVDRSNFYIVQTPQTFKVSIIKNAFEKARNEVSFTDDASVLENTGVDIVLSSGSYENIKITTPEDLDMAEVIMGKRK